MSSTCPNGHPSDSTDYCDVCGAPIDPSATADENSPSASRATPASSGASGAPGAPGASPAPATTALSTTQPCPNCDSVNTADALFCESCGYDFTTGTKPRPAPSSSLDLGAVPGQPSNPDSAESPVAPPVAFDWVAEVWVDPDWYAAQESEDPCPSPGLPAVVPLQAQSVLIGRTSRSRNIHPEIECFSDAGVSRRQAQLTSDGQRWWVEDLQSSNGTYVAAASAPVPTEALASGQRRELAADDRIYVGAWTRIVVRRATPEEQAGQA